MHPTTNSLILASRKASKLLLRDFFELEMLQNSSRGTNDFVNKSFQRTKALLQDELQRNWKKIIFSDEKFDLPSNQNMCLLVHPLEGTGNLSKSLPFFSFMITSLQKINDIFVPIISLMIFPALHELYYAEKGGGAWFEKSSSDTTNKNARLRVSGCQQLENAYVTIDNVKMLDDDIKNFRFTGSLTYDLSLFASGKIDAICIDSLDSVLRPGFELFAKEVGGFNFPFNNGLISSNQKLGEKIKQLLTKTA